MWYFGLAAAGGRPATPDVTHASAAIAPPAASPAEPAAQATGFVGDDTCVACHEPEGKGLHLTLHGKSQNSRTPAARTGQACETCHGPGQAHVDTGDKTKIKRFTAMLITELRLYREVDGSNGVYQALRAINFGSQEAPSKRSGIHI